jgi:cytochrome P450
MGKLCQREGEDWRKQRKIVAPTFAPAAVAGMARLMAEAAQRQMTRWPEQRAKIDMARFATETTMAIISEALFSGDARLTSGEAGMHIGHVIAADLPLVAQLRPGDAVHWREATIDEAHRALREADDGRGVAT